VLAVECDGKNQRLVALEPALTEGAETTDEQSGDVVAAERLQALRVERRELRRPIDLLLSELCRADRRLGSLSACLAGTSAAKL
jgi:hypothetical protein